MIHIMTKITPVISQSHLKKCNIGYIGIGF